jgi:hypothetical protein
MINTGTLLIKPMDLGMPLLSGAKKGPGRHPRAVCEFREFDRCG